MTGRQALAMASCVIAVISCAVVPADANHFPWTTMLPLNSPAARYAHYMVTDESQGNVVMFGGCATVSTGVGGNCAQPGTEQIYFSDTWIWNGANWTQVPGPGPSPRANHAMAYDRQRNQVLVFGGQGPDGLLGDTWAFDGSNRTWRKVTDSGPSPRIDSAMAPATRAPDTSGRIVLFGGRAVNEQSGEIGFSGETWMFDGATWQPKQVAHSPRPRHRHGMIYDARRENTVLHGGIAKDSRGVDTPSTETWVWTGDDWSDRTYGEFGVNTDRQTTRLAYNPDLEAVVLAGGAEAGMSNLNVYTWDGDSWIKHGHNQSENAGAPAERTFNALAHDPVNHATLMFAGRQHRGPDPRPIFNDTLIWKGLEEADLSLALADLPDPVVSGMEVTYRAAVLNQGSQTAAGVTLTLDIPAKTDFKGTDQGALCAYSTEKKNVVCNLGNMLVNELKTVNVVVATGEAGQVTAAANVTSRNVDPVPADNNATADTIVAAGLPGLPDLVFDPPQSAPSITLDKDCSPTAGGTPVTITGTGLAGATVHFGDRTVTAVPDPARPDERLTVTAPEHAPGTVLVWVETVHGQSNKAPFTYPCLPGAGGGGAPLKQDGPGTIRGGTQPGGFRLGAPPATGGGSPPGSGAAANLILEPGFVNAFQPASSFHPLAAPLPGAVSAPLGSPAQISPHAAVFAHDDAIPAPAPRLLATRTDPAAAGAAAAGLAACFLACAAGTRQRRPQVVPAPAPAGCITGAAGRR